MTGEEHPVVHFQPSRQLFQLPPLTGIGAYQGQSQVRMVGQQGGHRFQKIGQPFVGGQPPGIEQQRPSLAVIAPQPGTEGRYEWLP